MGNMLLLLGLLERDDILASSKGSFICTILQTITHTIAFVKPVVEHCLELKIAQ